jgi:site-specific recombinase XerC
MVELLSREAAEKAQRGASTRLRLWSEAFDGWLAERQRNYRPENFKKAALAWRRLLTERGKAPWEMRREDIEEHAAWMEAQGYAQTTIYNAVGTMASFYRFCSEHLVDAECQADFNPAAGAKRPKIKRFDGVELLSQEEIEALLGILRRDDTPLGKRDYAFFLARLSLGSPLRNLQQLRWGQIDQDKDEAWARWRAETGRVRLPGETWEAIRAWLASGGRLEGMNEGDYIFAPLADPLDQGPINRAEAWVKGRYLSRSQILRNLKLYGRRAGIPEEKLNLMALRRTATRLWLEANGSMDDRKKLAEMQAFLDSQEAPRLAKYRLKWLPRIPKDEGGRKKGRPGNEPAAPVRKARPFQPGEWMTHGFYAHDQPAEEVVALLKENIQGIEEEIIGLRMLGRGLLEKQAKARNSKEAAQLAEAYTLLTARLAGMVEAEKQLAKKGEAKSWNDEFLAAMDKIAEQMGMPPVSEAARAEARGKTPELAAADRRLVEEIAGTRCVLRRTLALAREAEQKCEAGEYIKLTEIYSIGCSRLMRLLRTEGSEQDQLTAYVNEQIDTAIREVQEEWNLSL